MKSYLKAVNHVYQPLHATFTFNRREDTKNSPFFKANILLRYKKPLNIWNENKRLCSVKHVYLQLHKINWNRCVFCMTSEWKWMKAVFKNGRILIGPVGGCVFALRAMWWKHISEIWNCIDSSKTYLAYQSTFLLKVQKWLVLRQVLTTYT